MPLIMNHISLNEGKKKVSQLTIVDGIINDILRA